MIRARLPLLAVALVAVFGAACGKVADTATPASATGHSDAPAQALKLSWIDRVWLAPRSTPFAGVRRVEYALPGATSLRYDERVAADGRGRFSIVPLDVLAPPMTAAQRETFELLQENRAGFFFQYRDFGVRNRELFAANYRVVELPAHVAVAGRDCVEAEVRRTDHAATWYLVDTDVTTGLVLRSREYTSDGHLLASVEFSEVTLTPSLNDVAWHEDAFAAETTQLTPDAIAGLGYTPTTPNFLPAGFQLLTTQVVRAEGQAWVRRVYGDGVESLFVLQSRAPAFAPRDTGVGRAAVDAGNQDLLGASNTPSAVLVRLCAMGPWTLAEAKDGPSQIFVVGKMGETEVVRVLQSAL